MGSRSRASAPAAGCAQRPRTARLTRAVPFVLAAAIAVGLASRARAGDAPESPPEPPRTPQETAERVVRAAAGAEPKALDALAADPRSDPWLVVDALEARGAHDAAVAYARAVPGRDAQALRPYVAWARNHPETATVRSALAKADAAYLEARYADVSAALAGTRPVKDAVPAIRCGYLAADVAGIAGDTERAIRELEGVADAAERIGWLSAASAALHRAATWAARPTTERTVALHARRVELERRRDRGSELGRALAELGIAEQSLGRFRPALERIELAIAALATAGDRTAEASAHVRRGTLLAMLGRAADAGTALDRAVALARETGDRSTLTDVLHEAGAALTTLGARDRAYVLLEEALTLAASPGSELARARIEVALALLERDRGRAEQALARCHRALPTLTRSADAAGLGSARTCMGICAERLGRTDEALEHYAAAAEAHRRSGDRNAAARSLANLGGVYEVRGDYEKALEMDGRALAEFDASGDRTSAAMVRGNMAIIHRARGEYDRSLALFEEVARVFESMGDRVRGAMAKSGMASVHEQRGDLARALELREQILDVVRKDGRPDTLANAHGNVGSIRFKRGEYALARAAFEEELRIARAHGLVPQLASALSGLGTLFATTAEHAQALASLKEAVTIYERVRDERALAHALSMLGSVHFHLHDYERALEVQRRGLDIERRLGIREETAGTLGNVGITYFRLGRRDEALAHLREGLALREKLGERVGLSATLTELAGVLEEQGDHREALPLLDRAVVLGREAGAVQEEARALLARAKAKDATLDRAGSIADARRAVELLGRMFAGLGDESGSSIRDHFWEAWAVGAEAALAADDREALVFFLESGRAGSLRDALGEREALAKATVPEGLRSAEDDARRAIGIAHARLTAALARGALEPVREARAAWETSHARHAEAIGAIRRAARNAASLLYPEPDDLAAIRSRLRDDEALVLYGLLTTDVVAVVVTRTESRTVPLGRKDAFEGAGASVLLGESPYVDVDAAARLRVLAAQPLALSNGIRRVLVSPMGALSYAPAALLWPDREVVHVPSGTTYGVLAAGDPARGEKVLAIGDPDYRTQVGVQPAGPRLRSRSLGRLPASRAEAEQVGDVTLLGESATEAGLREALARSGRWRAVHFACHGFVDAEDPRFSSLALTPQGQDDGYLTASQVCLLRIPADLVVLSACETARGRAYRSEGVAGLVRAFTLAGAQAVLASLWKVDDVATQALMKRFYELWNPKSGAGLPAATALVRAQESVRAEPRWRHPKFWAAWVLWGAPR